MDLWNWNVKTWSSEFNRMRINPILMSQRDDTGLLSNRSDRWVRYRVDIVKNLKVTEVSNTGIDVVPIQVPSPVQASIPVPDVSVLMLYRTCRGAPCRYWCCTEHTDSARYRYESLYWYRRYQYLYRIEPTEASGTGNTGGPWYIKQVCLGTYRTDTSLEDYCKSGG